MDTPMTVEQAYTETGEALLAHFRTDAPALQGMGTEAGAIALHYAAAAVALTMVVAASSSRTHALHKLLEARDAALRALVDAAGGR